MSIKNYFKIGLKKPELEENEKKSHERKHSFLKNIEDCESRLETIEICNSNSKLNDSILLSRYLLIDITNTLLQFYNQSEINDFGLVKSSLEKIPNADIVSRLEENILSLNFFFEDEENCSKIELALTDAIYFIRKNIISKHSQELYSPLDDYKSRIRFQTVIILILLILISGKLTTDYIKKRPLGPDNLEISYSIIKDTNPDDSNKKSFEINTKGEWNTIEMEIPLEENPIAILKIFPGHQNSARFQIRNLKLFNKENKVVYENPLIFNDSLMSELSNYMWSENVKPGKLNVGKPLEMESTSNKPQVFFKFSKLEKATKLQFELRIKKRAEKFTD